MNKQSMVMKSLLTGALVASVSVVGLGVLPASAASSPGPLSVGRLEATDPTPPEAAGGSIEKRTYLDVANTTGYDVLVVAPYEGYIESDVTFDLGIIKNGEYKVFEGFNPKNEDVLLYLYKNWTIN